MSSTGIKNGRMSSTRSGLSDSDIRAIASVSGYISNPNAETDTSGWATYADAAGTSPVDGTGGSPNITWTRSTSNPLRGVANFLLTKDAANRQGQGVSYDFTIARADQAKVLTISFDYEIGSGTYTDNDIGVWIYDVTNAVLIQPAPYNLLNLVGPGKFQANFQTASNSTSYRLILHVASTSALAYTLKVDNFSVDNINRASVSFLPASSVTCNTSPGTGSSNTKVLRWTNVAYTGTDITVTQSSTNGDTFTINTSGIYSITAILRSTQASFSYGIGKNANGTTNIGALAAANRLAFGEGTVSNQPLSLSATVKLVAGDVITAHTGPNADIRTGVDTVQFSITKIAASDNLASDSGGRAVACRIYRTAALSGSGSVQVMDFDTKAFDTHNAYDLSTDTFTVPEAGLYVAAFNLTKGATSAYHYAYIYHNGVVKANDLKDANQFDTANTSVILDCRAGDTIQFKQDVAASAIAVGEQQTFAYIYKISNSSQIAASELVRVRVKNSSLAITGAALPTPLVYATKDYDSHGAFTLATGAFVAPKAGLYSFGVYSNGGNPNWTAGGESYMIYLYKNAGVNPEATLGGWMAQAACNGIRPQVSGYTELYLNAGDSIVIKAYSDRSMTLPSGDHHNSFTISSIG